MKAIGESNKIARWGIGRFTIFDGLSSGSHRTKSGHRLSQSLIGRFMIKTHF